MSLNLRVIQPTEIDEILEYENRRLTELVPNETDRMFQAWHSRWRKESLEHYIPQGWSFLARDVDNSLIGYFLAQPLLFFDGQTQSLWVEHLQSSSLQARDSLTELAYKLSREKHFQRVYFPNNPTILNSVRPYKPEEWNAQTLFVKTTKA
jgi:hypothetical protein